MHTCTWTPARRTSLATVKPAKRPGHSQRCIVRPQAAKERECHVSIAPTPVEARPVCSSPTCRIPIFLAVTAAFGAAYWFKRQAELPKKKLPEPWPEIPQPDGDPKAYQLALARTRQALYVQKAVSYMKAGQPARCLVELHRALDENSICRSPLLDGHQTQEELEGLYKVHLKNTEVPPNFALLLQMREMLGIKSETAEAIEADVMEADAAFSI